MVAETLLLVDGFEIALYVLDVVRGLSMFGEDLCPDVVSIIESTSLFDAVHSVKLTSDRCVRLDISAVREMCGREEVHLQWIETCG